MNEVEEEEGAKWLAKALAPEVRSFHQRKSGKGFSVFRTEVAVKGCADLMPKTPGSLARKKNFSVLGQQLAWRDMLKFAKTPGKEWNRIFGQKITESPSVRVPFYREGHSLVKERNLRSKQLETVFPSTLPKYWNYMHSLKLIKERYKELYAFRKEKKERRKKGKRRETFMFHTADLA